MIVIFGTNITVTNFSTKNIGDEKRDIQPFDWIDIFLKKN